MRKLLQLDIIKVGLAIFSMFFGAGNLMYPIKVGISSGTNFFIGMAAFLITSVLLPLSGLIAMILFEGNYKAFFYRLGAYGRFLLICSILIIGPIIALPRIVTLSYTMMSPFIPQVSLFVFCLIFLGITFLCTYRENQIMNLLGKFISPALLISLIIIIFKGLLTADQLAPVYESSWNIFKENFWRGYETLDLLASIFFSSIILHLLNNIYNQHKKNNSELALIGLKAGLIGVSLLAIVYVGLGLLGVYHGIGFENVNPGELFKDVAFKILGSYGCAVIAIAVFMACLSTAIALTAVVAEFVEKDIFRSKISFAKSLAIVLVSCIPLSLYGLETVLKFTGGPITYIGYPILITLTLLNIAYKLFGFKPVKLPVLIITLVLILSYLI